MNNYNKTNTNSGYSVVVQWLGLHTFDAGGQGSIPYQVTEIWHALWHEKGEKKKNH